MTQDLEKKLTPKQLANALGVSEASVKRWCDKGLINFSRTAGGHRRLALNDVVAFLRSASLPLADSKSLGLPSITGLGASTLAQVSTALLPALAAGDLHTVEQLLLGAYTAGHMARDIFDQVVAPALCQIGERWQRGEILIFEERRACDIVQRALERLGRLLPSSDRDAPVALGGTIAHDHFILPGKMVEITLREMGWKAQLLGTHIPLQEWLQVVSRHQPRLLWLSLSHIAEINNFIEQYQNLFACAQEHQTMIVLGGRALSTELRQKIRYTVFCDTLSHLATFLQAVGVGQKNRDTST